uniref:Ribonuclease H n=1 Tax=Tetraselmis sp. GSL018 TaxID=582737 RepID=A0A061SMA3_9CHLO|mmetsp:Transcript_33649/g.79859  ORF Transcript_33649/g.79859 Transcript_33649/m.79859 type:complete len:162 (+) Transcript_33649:465-950(+)
MGGQKWYAVARGRASGVFSSWAECEKQVKGFKGALFKGFPNKHLAENFIMQNVASPCTPSRIGVSRTEHESPDRESQRPPKRHRKSEAPCEPGAALSSSVHLLRFDGGSRLAPRLAFPSLCFPSATRLLSGPVRCASALKALKGSIDLSALYDMSRSCFRL